MSLMLILHNMNPTINPVRYPTLYMYLARLPNGISSYPQVQTISDLPISVRNRWPDLVKRDDLPSEVREAISVPWKPGVWIPDVHFMVITALVRDVIYREDAGYLKFCYDTARESFSGPLMRHAVHFVSPWLLGLSAGKRWEMLKRGTTFKIIKSAKTDVTMSLTYPINMYHTCMINGFGQSLQAAIDCSRARDGKVVVSRASDTETHFHITWTG